MLNWKKIYVKVTSLSIVNIPSIITNCTLEVKSKSMGLVILIDGQEIDNLNSQLMKYHCRGLQENWNGT